MKEINRARKMIREWRCRRSPPCSSDNSSNALLPVKQHYLMKTSPSHLNLLRTKMATSPGSAPSTMRKEDGTRIVSSTKAEAFTKLPTTTTGVSCFEPSSEAERTSTIVNSTSRNLNSNSYRPPTTPRIGNSFVILSISRNEAT